MSDGEKVIVTESIPIVSWSLFFTAVVAGICLGQHFAYYGQEEDRNIPQTPTVRLQKELEEERLMVSKLKTEVKEEQEAKNEALKRLSAIRSSPFWDGNPYVVDLSDQNRPEKVGEQFSELYVNQWTDAYSVVENYFGEEETIGLLLDVLRHCYQVCEDKARAQLNNLRKGVKSIEAMITEKSTKLQSDLMRRIKEERKLHVASEIIDDTKIVKQFKKRLSKQGSSDLLETSEMKAFIHECLRVCWLMVIQDPPMTILMEPETSAHETFKAYKKTGIQVDFVVWPALLLQEGGPLIVKGVAEFRKY